MTLTLLAQGNVDSLEIYFDNTRLEIRPDQRVSFKADHGYHILQCRLAGRVGQAVSLTVFPEHGSPWRQRWELPSTGFLATNTAVQIDDDDKWPGPRFAPLDDGK
jgi:hypothetical protein